MKMIPTRWWLLRYWSLVRRRIIILMLLCRNVPCSVFVELLSCSTQTPLLSTILQTTFSSASRPLLQMPMPAAAVAMAVAMMVPMTITTATLIGLRTSPRPRTTLLLVTVMSAPNHSSSWVDTIRRRQSTRRHSSATSVLAAWLPHTLSQCSERCKCACGRWNAVPTTRTLAMHLTKPSSSVRRSCDSLNSATIAIHDSCLPGFTIAAGVVRWRLRSLDNSHRRIQETGRHGLKRRECCKRLTTRAAKISKTPCVHTRRPLEACPTSLTMSLTT
mmetsp:Transcript_13798/g.26780  ORF Transcript_13798/g.26780 Transcript_13798/m.26780 type:complete len:274 (-) Transcript_13798:2819-3640(-)